MQTFHRAHFKDSRDMRAIAAASVELVVTSPPYPMIEMWDKVFGAHSPAVGRALKQHDGRKAFDLMHGILDAVWQEVYRILTPGGFACINIGDAARTIGADFMLYPNHARILSQLLALGFTPLPAILWRKQTNAPNKFMGSGMYPAGAYVTLEHEYILIVRKGSKREFDSEEKKQRRRESAIFWEERNAWYSDVWMELKGARQDLGQKDARDRSGAFPFELAYRLISMFSAKGDTVVDPFLGTGTTLRAAAAAGRSSIGYEIEPAFRRDIFSDTAGLAVQARRRVKARIDDHLAFIEERRAAGREIKHLNRNYGFPVVTRQEMDLILDLLECLTPGEDRDSLMATYADDPCRILDAERISPGSRSPVSNGQLSLWNCAEK
jgi:DNA modification methylase